MTLGSAAREQESLIEALELLKSLPYPLRSPCFPVTTNEFVC